MPHIPRFGTGSCLVAELCPKGVFSGFLCRSLLQPALHTRCWPAFIYVELCFSLRLMPIFWRKISKNTIECILIPFLYIETNILKYFTNTNDINRYFLLRPLFFTLNPLKIRQYGCIVQDAWIHSLFHIYPEALRNFNQVHILKC